jgi:hypothetical protein
VPTPAISDEEQQYARVINMQVEDERERLRQSLMQSVNKNPDQVAQIERLAKETGLPQPVVERNLARVVADKRTSELQESARFSPILGQQLTNPNFASVAYDDVPRLSGLEYVLTKGRDYAGSLGKGVIGQGVGSTLSGFGELYGVATRQLEGLLDQVLPNSAMSFLRTPVPWYVAPEQVLKRPGQELKDFGKLIGAPESRRGLDTDVIEGIGQLGFQIAAALTTGGASSTSMLTAQGADVMAEKTRKDDATQAQKDAAIILGSGITAFTERYGLDKILNRVPPEVRNRTLRFLADKAAAFGIEFTQELTEGLLHDITRRITTNENAPILEGALQEGTAAGLAAAIVRTALGVRGFKQAKDQEEFFRALADNSKNSKLRERLPEQFQDLVRKISENGPVQNVYIPADQFRTFYQSQGVDPAVKAAELGARNYTEAAAAGTDVVIPIDEFTAKVAPSDDLQGLFNDLRLSQGDMTAREYQQYQQDEAARLEEIRQRAAEIAGEVQTPAFDTIKQSMRENLVATGYEQTTADAYATVYAKTITNLAERSGVDPIALHQKYDLTVTRPLPDVLTRDTRSDINIDPLLDRLRAKDFPTNQQIYGKTLTDFLIEKGGLQPVAELTDVDLGRGPFQRNLLQPTGLSADEAAMLAVEAGYLQGRSRETVTESDLFEAIENELAGGVEFSIYEINQELQGLAGQLDQLNEYLSSIGIDIDQVADNAEVRRLLDQASQDPEIQNAFDRLFQAAPTSPELIGENEGRVLRRDIDNLNEVERQAFDDFMANRPDAQRIIDNLTKHKGTPFAAQAMEGIFVRQAMQMYLRGETPAFESSMASNQVRKVRETLQTKGEEGMWQLLEISGGLMGAAAKPVNNINSSFINCDPSPDCARYCYATAGNYRYANVIVKSELVTLAVELNPVRAAQRVAAEYRATAEFANNKALRLFDKGDGNDAWIPFIKELNKQGIRVQIFSKVPEFLRQVPDINLRLLSIDNSNMQMADQNPDLPVAFVYTGRDQVDMLAKLAARNQIQVVLPVKLGRNLLDGTQITDLKKAVPAVKPYLCPIDAGFKKLGKTSQPGTWNCTSCDRNGGVGCFHGNATKQVMESLEVKPVTPQERAQRILDLRRQINELTTGTAEDLAGAGRIPQERVAGLLNEVDALLGQLLTDYDGGTTQSQARTIGSGVVEQGNRLEGAVQPGAGRRVIPITRLGQPTIGAAEPTGVELPSAQEVVMELGRIARRESPRTIDPRVDRINAAELYVQDMARQNPEAAAALAAEMKANAETWSEESGLPPAVIGKYASIIERRLQIFRQGEGMADKRGFIQFGPERKFKIALLEKADLSTFLHESGHFYLEVLGDLASMAESSQQIKDDYAAVLKFLNLESRDQLSLDGKTPGSAEYRRAVEAHEKFARANEAYLMEGKAPSQELRSIFQRFRNWLKLIYKEFARLNVELTKEVRGVFDRIYATDEEIDAAKAEMLFDPLFLDATAAGMTDAEFEAYQQSVAQATESGKEALQQKLMREMMRERQAWWKEELSKVREQVAAEVDELPVYRAFKELTEGEIKLNKNELIERYGIIYIKRLPRGFQRVYTTGDGMPLDAAARMMGFGSGDALVEALVGMKPRNEYIRAESDRVMQERHGDMLTDGTISDEAKIALHNGQREKVLAAELRALRRKQREVAPFIQLERQRQAGQRRAAKAATEVPPTSAFRLAAQGMIGQTAIRDLEPQRFLNAQRREGKKAFNAMASGDYTAAAEAKQKELLNHFLYLEARKARDRADKIATNMRKYERKETRQRIGKAGKSYLEQIDAILDGYEFRRLPNKLIDRRAMLNAFVAKQEEAGEPVNIPVSVLEDARQINYRLLSVDELNAVDEAVRNIANLASLKNRLTLLAEKRELNEVASEAIEHILANAKGGKAKKIETALPGEQLGRWAKGFMLIHKKFATFFRQMDGWQDGGMMWNLFVRPLNDRADFEAVQRAEATKKLREIFRVYRDTNMFAKTYIPALGQGMTLQGRLMVALNWGRLENRQRLMDGNGFSQSQIDGIFETLTERDWQFVKDVWAYLDSYWPQISEQYERLYGVPPEKSDNAPFMTKYGMMPGGYFPIKYDPIKSTQAQAQSVEEVTRLMKSGAYVRSQTKNGFTKEVLENLDRAIKLDFSPIYEHVNEVIHDLAMREYLLDTNKLLNHRVGGTTLKDTINEVYGDQAFREIADTIRDVAAGDIGAQNAFDAALGHLRAGVSIVGMGWNLSTGLMQPLGITQSIVRVGPRWIAKGLFKFGSDAVSLQNSGKMIYEKSAFMRTRALTQNREINEIRNQIKRQGKFPVAREAWGMVEDSYFQFITQFQKLVDFPTWLGSYEKALAYGKSDAEAVAMADQAVIDSQSGGQIKDLAKVQRGSQLMKIWTNFYSYFNTTFNLTLESFGKTKFTDPISIGRLAVDVLMLYTAPAILGLALKEAINLVVGGEEPDEEEMIDKMLREQLTYMMGTMVGVREFATIFDPRFGYSGPAGVRFIAEMERLGTQIGQGELDAALRKSAINVGGMLLHFPAGQVNRIIDGIYALEEGKSESPAAVIFGAPKD